MKLRSNLSKAKYLRQPEFVLSQQKSKFVLIIFRKNKNSQQEKSFRQRRGKQTNTQHNKVIYKETLLIEKKFSIEKK